MRSTSVLAVAASLMLAIAPITACRAEETVVVGDVGGPEGALYADGNLYFVSWAESTLSKWDGKTVTVLNTTPGCGANGVVLTHHKTFMIACSADSGAIIEADLQGKELRRWDADSAGKKFEGINDLVVAKDGGIYATICGPVEVPPKVVVGTILYLASGSDKWVDVAHDLTFANGIGLSPDQKTLYVDETIGNAILKFSVNADGTLSNRSYFALVNLLMKNKTDSWFIGPDSMKIDSKGNLYVAQWSGGKIIKISPDGKLLHVFDIAAGDGTTNVALGEGEKELFVTVVKDPNDEQLKGSVVIIPNVG